MPLLSHPLIICAMANGLGISISEMTSAIRALSGAGITASQAAMRLQEAMAKIGTVMPETTTQTAVNKHDEEYSKTSNKKLPLDRLIRED